MKASKKWLVVLMTLALLVVSACGSGGSGSNSNKATDAPKSSNSSSVKDNASSKPDPVTIRIAWWGGEPRHNYTMQVIDLYKKANPHVTIEMEYANYDDYWKKLAPQAAANELPDIIQIDTQNYSQYAGRKQLAELSPFLGNQIDTTNISQNAIDAGKFGDGIYGMNLGTNALAFNYDPALLAKAGVTEIDENWTWDDYVALAEKAKGAGLFVDTGFRAEVFFGYFLRTKGATLYNAEGTGLGYEDDSLFVEHFSRLAKLVEEKKAPTPDAIAQVKGLEDDFVVKEQAIGIWQWSNQFVALQQFTNRPFELAPLPGPNATQGLYLKPSMFFSISENSKVKEEAAKFINFFVNDVEANKLILGDRGVPVSSVVKEGMKDVLSPAQVQVFDYVAWAETNSSVMDPADPIGASEVYASLNSMVEQMNYNKISPEDAAARFRQEANSILSKNK